MLLTSTNLKCSICNRYKNHSRFSVKTINSKKFICYVCEIDPTPSGESHFSETYCKELKRIKRKCLRCDKQFSSSSKGNRLCSSCRAWGREQWLH